MMFDENGRRIRSSDIQKSEQIYSRSSMSNHSIGPCKGICKKYKATKPLLKSRYAAGQVRCQVCEIYLTLDGIKDRDGPQFCKCCNYRVRTKPRNSGLKDKYHKLISRRNVHEQWIKPEIEEQILSIRNTLEEPKLKPIKEALPINISYFTIKMVLLKNNFM